VEEPRRASQETEGPLANLAEGMFEQRKIVHDAVRPSFSFSLRGDYYTNSENLPFGEWRAGGVSPLIKSSGGSRPPLAGSEPMAPRRLLIVDDEPLIRET